MLKKVAYSKIGTSLLHFICGLFYNKKYLTGKFYEEKRMGYYWALECLPRLRKNRRYGVDWPIGKHTNILNGGNISFDPSSINVFQQFGCYYQAFDKIIIGKDVWIGQNVGIITANHDLVNPEIHQNGKQVVIGDKCWIGMNSVILPGVVLGPNIVVGAGSIVTKSFIEGHCVIAGNPARKMKKIGI